MRSHLYVPGDKPERLAKCLDRGADFVIVDLEDAVAPGNKAQGRQITSEWIRANHERADEIWVRVNNGPELSDDLQAAVTLSIAGIVFPKCDNVEALNGLDFVLSNIERSLGIQERSVGVSALIETAEGVLNAREIAGGPRVNRLQVGEFDLRADLGVELGPDERELLYVRSLVVLVSAAARINPPVAPVSTDFKDLDRFRETTKSFARMGYVGRACIHPAQITIANEVFTPTDEELDAARVLIEQYESAGGGVITDRQGHMVDEAVIRSARRVISRG
jgi:citrate lyase subunit beta/citryl-CoA lyase